MTLLDRMEASRTSPAVLRMDVLRLIGRDSSKFIMVLEGVDDVGVYNSWIRRFRDGDWFRIVPGRGKGQLLSLLREIRAEKLEKFEFVRFFVDHDYDGVSDEDRCAHLHVTDRYSIENYLIDRSVVEQIMIDELRCAADVSSLDAAMDAFDRFYGELLEAVIDAMGIYRAGVVTGARSVAKPEKLNQNLQISHRGAQCRAEWDCLISFDPAPREDFVQDCVAFIRSAQGAAHRGKWLLFAVRAWLGLMYEDRRSDQPVVFPAKQRALGPAPDQVSLAALAARSPVPAALKDFVLAA